MFRDDVPYRCIDRTFSSQVPDMWWNGYRVLDRTFCAGFCAEMASHLPAVFYLIDHVL